MAEDMARESFSDMASDGTVLSNYMSILKIILRLRQLCTHPGLWSDDKWKEVHALGADNDSADSHASRRKRSKGIKRAESNSGSGTAAGSESATSVTTTADVKPKNESKGEPKQESMGQPKQESRGQPNDDPQDEPQYEPMAAAKPESEMSSADTAAYYERWRSEAARHGQSVKCDYCEKSAISAGVIQNKAYFHGSDYPGPALTRCMHIACRQCQVVIFGAAPSGPEEHMRLCREAGPSSALYECVLCGDMLEINELVPLPAQVVFSAIGDTDADPGAAAS
ncbi:hypothetical protein EV175_006989, partial [Coemansia sp. RSA 1933]